VCQGILVLVVVLPGVEVAVETRTVAATDTSSDALYELPSNARGASDECDFAVGNGRSPHGPARRCRAGPAETHMPSLSHAFVVTQAAHALPLMTSGAKYGMMAPAQRGAPVSVHLPVPIHGTVSRIGNPILQPSIPLST
jgi:hypothetical protein